MALLPYGTRPYRLGLENRAVTWLAPPTRPPPPPVRELLDRALDVPVGARLEATAGDRVTIVVSDATRDEPRDALVAAVLDRLPAVDVTLAIATGTHGPCGDLAELRISPDVMRRIARVVDHDGHRDDDLVALGTTPRGTPVRIHRCAVECDLVVATGCIRPHYFAGFGAGAKAIFPGLGAATDIRINHRLKTDVGARAGRVDGNPCRDDLEDAVALVSRRTFLLDGVCGPDGLVHDAVAGDVRAAFRAGVARCRPWFTVDAVPAPIVIASDALPVTATLYQASKIAASVAPLVERDGLLVIVAECANGTGPVDVVNRAIFDIGIAPRLAAGVRVALVSALPREVVGATYATWFASVDDAIADRAGDVLVVPRATQILLGASS
jgi:nickel-dependent lactate racemase